jgi:hypothetical protein
VHNAILMEEMEHHKITLYCVKERHRYTFAVKSDTATRSMRE